MGLCKCSKRKVTNLFCFEHKVNVCEDCIVTKHVRCVVKSYLQWLQDSDFDPLCCICEDSLETGDVVRLLCYDVLHVSCAEKFLLAYPAHTAPDGFFCPACHAPFMPQDNAASPVADALKEKLGSMADLQKRLSGLSPSMHSAFTCPPTAPRPDPEGKEVTSRNIPYIQGTREDVTEQSYSETIHDSPSKPTSSNNKYISDDAESVSSASDFIATHSLSQRVEVPTGRASPSSDAVVNIMEGADNSFSNMRKEEQFAVNMDGGLRSTIVPPSPLTQTSTVTFAEENQSATEPFQSQGYYSKEPPRSSPQLPYADSKYGASSRLTSNSRVDPKPHTLGCNDDHDEHKYRRKPLMEMVKTWLKIFSPPRSRRPHSSFWGRYVIITMIGLMSLIFLVLLFHRLGRTNDDEDDPLLDLKANPFVKFDHH